ncbi:hypothetical protein SAMN05444521_4786 [Streptomyces sp. 3214.6]|nr:hypothetical protein SAMN05444521_4786 [Streptomyces sp. 3214.6]
MAVPPRGHKEPAPRLPGGGLTSTSGGRAGVRGAGSAGGKEQRGEAGPHRPGREHRDGSARVGARPPQGLHGTKSSRGTGAKPQDELPGGTEAKPRNRCGRRSPRREARPESQGAGNTPTHQPTNPAHRVGQTRAPTSGGTWAKPPQEVQATHPPPGSGAEPQRGQRHPPSWANARTAPPGGRRGGAPRGVQGRQSPPGPERSPRAGLQNTHSRRARSKALGRGCRTRSPRRGWGYPFGLPSRSDARPRGAGVQGRSPARGEGAEPREGCRGRSPARGAGDAVPRGVQGTQSPPGAGAEPRGAG